MKKVICILIFLCAILMSNQIVAYADDSTETSDSRIDKVGLDFDRELKEIPTPNMTPLEEPSTEKNGSREAINPNKELQATFNDFLTRYRSMIIGINGVCFLICIGLMVWRFMVLGASAGNPMARRNALISIGITAVGIAVFGSITLFFGLFYNGLQ